MGPCEIGVDSFAFFVPASRSTLCLPDVHKVRLNPVGFVSGFCCPIDPRVAFLVNCVVIEKPAPWGPYNSHIPALVFSPASIDIGGNLIDNLLIGFGQCLPDWISFRVI